MSKSSETAVPQIGKSGKKGVENRSLKAQEDAQRPAVAAMEQPSFALGENYERLIKGLGFYENRLPTWADCRQLIQERAYFLWTEAGWPEGSGEEFWCAAEKELFPFEPLRRDQVSEGYIIQVCDSAKSQGYTRTWVAKLVTPDDIQDVDMPLRASDTR